MVNIDEKVSVIIPTYNGKHKISNVLTSLSAQSFKDFELLIIIDGSTDKTEDFLKENNFGIDFKIHSQENKGRAAVRNKGAVLAEGSLLIFLDDDMRPAPDFISAHLAHHKKNPGSILSGVQVDDPGKAKTDFQKYKCWLSNQWNDSISKFQDLPQAIEHLYITAANFSISKYVFFEIGGFDENLRDCEDYDLAIRAHQKGVPVYFSTTAFAWHDEFSSPSSFIKRQREYNQSHKILVKKDPIKFHQLKSTRLKQPSVKSRMFFSMFKYKFWITAIEKNAFFFLPQSLRFKMYTWIITAHTTYKEFL
jgi:GT2 family glycosyltransferase